VVIVLVLVAAHTHEQALVNVAHILHVLNLDEAKEASVVVETRHHVVALVVEEVVVVAVASVVVAAAVDAVHES